MNFNHKSAEMEGLTTETAFTRISAINHRLGHDDDTPDTVRALEFTRQLHASVADNLELHFLQSYDQRLQMPIYMRAVNSKGLGLPQELIHIHMEVDFKLAFMGIGVFTYVSDNHQSNTVRDPHAL